MRYIKKINFDEYHIPYMKEIDLCFDEVRDHLRTPEFKIKSFEHHHCKQNNMSGSYVWNDFSQKNYNNLISKMLK